jgi:hypothetical protein
VQKIRRYPCNNKYQKTLEDVLYASTIEKENTKGYVYCISSDLDNMVGISQSEFSLQGGIIRTWEWKGGTLPFESGSDGGAPTIANKTLSP